MRLDGIQPFDPYVDEAFMGNFPKSLTEPLTIDGKIYSVPEALSTRLMYYRTDLYEKAGFSEPPKTWDDFVKVMQAVNAPPKPTASASRAAATKRSGTIPTSCLVQAVTLPTPKATGS